MVKPPRPSKQPAELLLLHIELKWVTPTIWRRFAVPETITLGKLHHAIQAVMGWGDCHLHEFIIAGEHYGTPDPDDMGPTVNPEARKTLIKALNGKRSFSYIYDFGDGWEHSIKVEKKLPAIACPYVPYCIEGANTCPPEDIGGATGYEEFVEIMANPKHPEHAAMIEWHGGMFDPAVYDCEEVNGWFEQIKA